MNESARASGHFCLPGIPWLGFEPRSTKRDSVLDARSAPRRGEDRPKAIRVNPVGSAKNSREGWRPTILLTGRTSGYTECGNSELDSRDLRTATFGQKQLSGGLSMENKTCLEAPVTPDPTPPDAR